MCFWSPEFGRYLVDVSRNNGKFEMAARMESKHGGGCLAVVFEGCKAQKQVHIHKGKTHFQNVRHRFIFLMING
mgnify:FL=1